MIGAGRFWSSRFWPSRYWAKMGTVAFAGLMVKVEAQLDSVWTDISDDLNATESLRIAYGIAGNGPLDCMAGTGTCEFAVNNFASGSRLEGAYSPLHENARSGWTFGVPIRVTLIYRGLPYVKHCGKAQIIDPLPGVHRERRVRVVSFDGIRDLMEADVRELSIQIDQTETQLIAAVLDSIPEAAPSSTYMDEGVDTIAYAFHDLGSGVKAAALIQDVLVDSQAVAVMEGNGRFVVRNRHERASWVSDFTLDDTMNGFVGPSDLSQAYNVARVTIPQHRFDDVATTVLYADQTVRAIEPGTSADFWVTYRDPAQSQNLIGAVDGTVTTQYEVNSQADGLGSDLSGSLLVTFTPFASTAHLVMTNQHATATMYLVDGAGQPALQVFGQGVYDLGTQTYQVDSAQAYGNRVLPIDLRYQGDPEIAHAYASFMVAQRKSIGTQPQSVGFSGSVSSEFMVQALAKEPLHVITVSESMTGFSDVDAVIQSVALEIAPGPILSCEWGLAPVSPFRMWQLDESELDSTTILGF